MVGMLELEDRKSSQDILGDSEDLILLESLELLLSVSDDLFEGTFEVFEVNQEVGRHRAKELIDSLGMIKDLGNILVAELQKLKNINLFVNSLNLSNSQI